MLVRNEKGVPEVPIEWLMDHPGIARVVDVRSEAEFVGELGHIRNAELVPLDTLEQAASPWRRTEPLLTVCGSGGRSGKAAILLENLGFSQVASLAGGMRRWNELRLPVEK